MRELLEDIAPTADALNASSDPRFRRAAGRLKAAARAVEDATGFVWTAAGQPDALAGASPT